MARVTWLDAWMDADAEVEIATVKDDLALAVDIAGFVKKTSKAVVLASNYSPVDGLVRFVTKIPMSLVQEIAISTSEEVVFTRKKEKSDAKEAKEA